LIQYYNTWKFKHPNANDFTRVAEKTSGLQLQWLKEYWVNSTKTIDYGIADVQAGDKGAKVTLQRIGKLPMPIEVLVTYKDGSKEMHYMSLDLMLGDKKDETSGVIHDGVWKWVQPNYSFETLKSINQLKSIEIDPSYRMPDVNRQNNKLEIPN
jgi:hypothetical protein